MKMIACYIRLLATESNQTKQKRGIERWLESNRINPKSIPWYLDKKTGDRHHLPQWEELKTHIRDGKVSTVVIWHLDRLPGTTRDGLRVLIDWCEKSVRVVAVSQKLDVKMADGGLVASILRGVTEMDAHKTRERTKIGLAAARARGRLGGRPRLPDTDAKLVMAKKLRRERKLSIDEICQKLKISRTSYYRYVRR